MASIPVASGSTSSEPAAPPAPTLAPVRRPPVIQPSAGNSILINPCQRLNPILDSIRNVAKEFGDIVPDFQMGRTACALFLSLKYHRLHPEYIHQRIQKLGNMYTVRVLLIMCDVTEHQAPIRELTKICLINGVTIIVAWSPTEAGHYLSTFKQSEHRPPTLIKERVERDYESVLRAALTSVSKVNKMDVETLRVEFGSFAGIARAGVEELQHLPGLGPVKVRRIKDAFERPFKANRNGSGVGSSLTQTQTHGQPQSQRPKESDNGKEKDKEKGKQRAVVGTETFSRLKTLNAVPVTQERDKARPLGSAADMPRRLAGSKPPQMAGPQEREASPPWDIELDLELDLDLNESISADVERDEYSDGVGDGSGTGNKRQRISSPARNTDATDHGGPQANPGRSDDSESLALGDRDADDRHRLLRRRSPSPVWDIELDLN